MPSLPQNVLYAKLVAALPPKTKILSGVDEVRPLVAEIPGFGRVRLYLWTLTHIGQTEYRQPDEFKIELILPDQRRGAKAALDLSGRTFTVLLGYSPDYGVFGAWESRYHEQFGYSAHVHIREDVLVDAQASGWAVAPPRRLRSGDEVRAAFSPGNLIAYLVTAKEADEKNLSAEAREVFYVRRTPQLGRMPKKATDEDIKDYASRIRTRIATTRLSRDHSFGRLVRAQFSDACAVCETQLDVVEGAHIISVNEEGSEDEAWNGIALCRNHHKLFDTRVLTITPKLEVKIDIAIVQYLRDQDRAAGFETLLAPYENSEVRHPRFFDRNRAFRTKMINALRWREKVTGAN